MFSKSQIKLIRSLAQKKYRSSHGLFVVEGIKGISELMNSSLRLHSLYTTEDIFETGGTVPTIITEGELKKISNLNTPQTALAIFYISEPGLPEPTGLQLALDEIQDPGNLGTIIRMCDWFGIADLICSTGTVDCYNPKVVQATMGSIARVRVHYVDLPEYLLKAGKSLPIYGAFLEGKNIYQEHLEAKGIIVMGNEAKGISSKVEACVTKKLVIPQFGGNKHAESLNVATATAIFLSEFSRRSFIES